MPSASLLWSMSRRLVVLIALTQLAACGALGCGFGASNQNAGAGCRVGSNF